MLVGRREDRLEQVAKELGASATAVAADLTITGESERIVCQTLTAHGRIDVVIHSAGIFEKATIGDANHAHWQRVIDINLSAAMAITQAAWAALSESSGQIVLVSSIAATQAFEGNAAYAASKGGLNSLGEVLRLEGRAHRIRVIVLCPAQVDTELWDTKAPDAVRSRMMPAVGVGQLVANLLDTDRGIDIEPVTIRPPQDPWAVQSK